MERIVKIAKNFDEAEEWDIIQHVQMTPEERQEVASELRKRVHGTDIPDVRDSHLSK